MKNKGILIGILLISLIGMVDAVTMRSSALWTTDYYQNTHNIYGYTQNDTCSMANYMNVTYVGGQGTCPVGYKTYTFIMKGYSQCKTDNVLKSDDYGIMVYEYSSTPTGQPTGFLTRANTGWDLNPTCDNYGGCTWNFGSGNQMSGCFNQASWDNISLNRVNLRMAIFKLDNISQSLFAPPVTVTEEYTDFPYFTGAQNIDPILEQYSHTIIPAVDDPPTVYINSITPSNIVLGGSNITVYYTALKTSNNLASTYLKITKNSDGSYVNVCPVFSSVQGLKSCNINTNTYPYGNFTVEAIAYDTMYNFQESAPELLQLRGIINVTPTTTTLLHNDYKYIVHFRNATSPVTANYTIKMDGGTVVAEDAYTSYYVETTEPTHFNLVARYAGSIKPAEFTTVLGGASKTLVFAENVSMPTTTTTLPSTYGNVSGNFTAKNKYFATIYDFRVKAECVDPTYNKVYTPTNEGFLIINNFTVGQTCDFFMESTGYKNYPMHGYLIPNRPMFWQDYQLSAIGSIPPTTNCEGCTTTTIGAGVTTTTMYIPDDNGYLKIYVKETNADGVSVGVDDASVTIQSGNQKYTQPTSNGGYVTFDNIDTNKIWTMYVTKDQYKMFGDPITSIKGKSEPYTLTLTALSGASNQRIQVNTVLSTGASLSNVSCQQSVDGGVIATLRSTDGWVKFNGDIPKGSTSRRYEINCRYKGVSVTKTVTLEGEGTKYAVMEFDADKVKQATSSSNLKNLIYDYLVPLLEIILLAFSLRVLYDIVYK